MSKFIFLKHTILTAVADAWVVWVKLHLQHSGCNGRQWQFGSKTSKHWTRGLTEYPTCYLSHPTTSQHKCQINFDTKSTNRYMCSCCKGCHRIKRQWLQITFKDAVWGAVLRYAMLLSRSRCFSESCTYDVHFVFLNTVSYVFVFFCWMYYAYDFYFK